MCLALDTQQLARESVLNLKRTKNREADIAMEENLEPNVNPQARTTTEVEMSGGPAPPSFPTEITAADVRGRKRESEQLAEDLEAEIYEGGDDFSCLAVLQILDLFLHSFEPLLSIQRHKWAVVHQSIGLPYKNFRATKSHPEERVLLVRWKLDGGNLLIKEFWCSSRTSLSVTCCWPNRPQWTSKEESTS